MGLSRRWSVSGTRALAVFATTWIASGCRSLDCNDTATCAIAGDDVVTTANDTPGEASDDVVVANDSAVGANDDVVGWPVGPVEGTGDANDGGFEASNVVADANRDAADDRPLTEAAMADAGGGRDAASDAPPKCGSNVLTALTAVASSTTARVAGNAIDGNFTTRWESIWGVDPQWIYVDFGASVFVNRVQILWQHSCAANYDLQVSNDATTWVTMRSIVGNTMGGASSPTDWTTAVDHQGLMGFGRYVRVNGTARCSSAYGYSMWEMQVSGDRNASCTP